MEKRATRQLIDRLRDEKEHRISGGIYQFLQVEAAYNSNHIEGSTLTHEQTRYIFETHSVSGENIRADDVVETVNHFRLFDRIIDTFDEPLTEDYVKELHRVLKTGTFSSLSREAVVGDYKKFTNIVNDIETSHPDEVHEDMKRLLSTENLKVPLDFDGLLDFHASFEKIHPFYDGNGRIGRLLLFKECIRSDIVPFIIDDNIKLYYYRGMHEWQTGGEKGYLRDTCLSMQDKMKAVLDYFSIGYNKKNDERIERQKEEGRSSVCEKMDTRKR